VLTTGPARGRPQRSTKQGGAVLEALGEDTRFRSAQDLHAALRDRGENVGLTTVYRHLQRLADDGAVDAVRTDDGETLWRRCGTQTHHHHLVCRRCGDTVEIASPQIEAWAERVAQRAGFQDIEHTVEVVGTCASCAAG
jgi:Fur family ferric uptake transcriptional regulator